MLRYCSAGGGSIKGGGMEPPGKKRWNLRSSFPPLSTNLASTPFTHTHDCLVNPPMSVYSSVPSSTWSPFPPFFSLSTFYPFLHFPSSSYLSNTSSISPDAILGLVNSGSTQISVRGLFTRRLIISDKSEHSQIFAFLVIYQPLSLFLFFIEA